MDDEIRDIAINIIQDIREDESDKEVVGFFSVFLEFIRLEEKIKERDFIEIARKRETMYQEQRDVQEQIREILSDQILD